MARLFNINGIKEAFKKKNLKVGKEALSKFVELEEIKIEHDFKLIERKARISGRKVVRKEDLI